MEKIKRKIYTHYRDWLYICIFSISAYIFVYYTCIPREFSDDDWGIANYFVGVIDAEYATPYNKFINFIWGWVMYGMYKLLPGPNWFIIIQEFIVILSFALLQYMLIQKTKKHMPIVWCYLFTSVFLIAFELSFLSRLAFTQTAALGSIIGILWILFSYQKQSKCGYICGIILTVISALHRFASFEMCLPFAGLVLIDFWMSRIDGRFPKDAIIGILKDRKLYLTLAGITLCCLGLSKINTAIYNSDYYADYNAFNAARASVLDYPKAPYEDISEELESIGVSANDYNLITSWTIADLSFVTTDLLKDIAAIEPKANIEIDYKEEISKYFINLQDPKILYNKLFYMALISLAFCLLLDFKHMRWYAPALLAGTIMIEIYFKVIVRRYPGYVRTGLLFALIATVLMITDYSRVRALRDRKLVFVVALAMFFGLIPLGDEYYLAQKGSFKYNMDGLAMYEYMNSREEDIFMIPTGESGGLPALRNSYSIFKATKPGIMRHTVGLGGWSTNNPWVNEVYSSWGIDYPMSQVADDNVYLLATSGKVGGLQQYMWEHHDVQTTASLTAVEYGTTIYKITERNLNVSEKKLASIVNASIEYDNSYDTYDIAVDLEFYKSNKENCRVFISLENSMGIIGYYMVFGGNDMVLKEGRTQLLSKIPSATLVAGDKYRVNIMIQEANHNYKNKSEPVEIIIPVL